ncbi:MAG: hypothetical protein QOJ64_2346, partial [Acidobacteriota bacterium]|nr:hypothetical protein [Acidobacteriota bacterium]
PLKGYLFLVLSLGLLFACQPAAFGQYPGLDCSRIKESNDFPFLASLKGSLSAQIQELNGRIASLPSEIDDALAQSEIDRKLGELEALETKPNKKPEEQLRLDQLKLIVSMSEHSKESLQGELRAKNEELETKERLFECVQQRIASIWTPEQSFKLWMSLVGAALIFLVITGFFVLSFRDEHIRRAIFSGQTGIQFLTLFSIVIAIILFGITGVLQDKELAALLGGLSGYILGRYSNPTESNGGSGNPPNQPNNPPTAKVPAQANAPSQLSEPTSSNPPSAATNETGPGAEHDEADV